MTKVVRKCVACKDARGFPVPFEMAFQPIIDAAAGTMFAYEALVRGPEGQGAMTVLSAVEGDNRYAFDQACRIKAIETAAALALPATGALLSINFLPNAVYEPKACIRATLDAAERTGFPTDRLMFEITEGEQIVDHAHLANIIAAYRAMGFRTAIDDFGAGYCNLALLFKFQPDVLKLDMDLIRGIDGDRIRQSIVRNVLNVCDDIGARVIAEGVETWAEYETLRDLRIDLFQGYLFAKPGFQTLPEPVWPERERLAAVA